MHLSGWLHQSAGGGLLTQAVKVPTVGFSSHRLGCYSSLVSSGGGLLQHGLDISYHIYWPPK